MNVIEIHAWLAQYLQAVEHTFAQRVQFVGIQGSYARGEATETSDIDVVLILDEVSSADIRLYGDMLDNLPNRELICGFLSGKQDLLHWEPSDLFQFYHDTTPLRGSLDEVLPLLDAAAVNRAIKIGACNIYHGCVHNMLHEKSMEILQGLYKAATFVVQAICYQQTGRYFRKHAESLEHVSAGEQMILEGYTSLKCGNTIEFTALSELLHDWAAQWITRT